MMWKYASTFIQNTENTVKRYSVKRVLLKVQQGISTRAALVLTEDLDVFIVKNSEDIDIAKQKIMKNIIHLIEIGEISICKEYLSNIN